MSKLLISVTRPLVLAALLLVAGAIDWSAHAQSDPLPLWNGATKKSITDFVARVTPQSGPVAQVSPHSTTTVRFGSSSGCMCRWPPAHCAD
jgi:hypothetical protein